MSEWMNENGLLRIAAECCIVQETLKINYNNSIQYKITVHLPLTIYSNLADLKMNHVKFVKQ